jgi:protein-disulfide isomerase
MSVIFELVLKYGVRFTPAIVVDGKVVHAGGLPDRARMAAWL